MKTGVDDQAGGEMQTQTGGPKFVLTRTENVCCHCFETQCCLNTQICCLSNMKQPKQHILSNRRLKRRLLHGAVLSFCWSCTETETETETDTSCVTVTLRKPPVLSYSSKPNHFKRNLILLSFRERTFNITGCWFEWENTCFSQSFSH